MIAALFALGLATSDATIVPEVIVTATPLQARVDERPGLSAADITRTASPSVLDTLGKAVPGASLSDVGGNPFSQGLDFRGFVASPVVGAPQGLAVYLGGMRLNEAFGDSVNWDLVPTVALQRADLATSDPAFGLNAIGGAVALTGKTGESFSGREVTVRGGAFGRWEGGLQVGGKTGRTSYYLAAEGARENGWRQRSPSSVARVYGDLGRTWGRVDVNFTAAAATSSLGVIGPTPIDLLSLDRSSVYTSPQNTRNTDGLATVRLGWRPSGGWELSGEAHTRRFVQHHLDGNDGNFEGCSRTRTSPLFNTLCMQDDDFPAAVRPPAAAFQVLDPGGAPIPCPPLVTGQTKGCNGVPYGTVDRARTTGNTLGLAVEVTRRGPLFGRRNVFILGGAVDTSRFDFASQSVLGLIDPNLVVQSEGAVPGLGSIIHTAGLIGYAPVAVSGRRTDAGVYASDTLALSNRLTLTTSARLNSIRISTQDQAGGSPELNGSSRYARLNPAVTANYAIVDGLSLSGGYSEANRAPTPLELGCSDPARPCLLENALVSDPPLKQVVAHTVEVGLKGERRMPGGQLSYRLSLYNADLDDDIVPLASVIQGRGYYTNVQGTRRRGFDASLRYQGTRLSAYASYGHVEATYRFSGLLASPNSPAADSNGNIAVRPGDRIGGIPGERFALGADLKLGSRLRLGADLVGSGPQPRAGDENGSDSRLPGFARLDLRGEWDLGPGVTFSAQVLNALDRRYSTYGTYFDPGGVAFPGSKLPALPDSRMNTPAAPRALHIGLSARW